MIPAPLWCGWSLNRPFPVKPEMVNVAMNAFPKKIIVITALALFAGTAWLAVEYLKEPDYDWIEVCTMEGVKRVKYDNEGNLLAEEWISQVPAHVLALIEEANKTEEANNSSPQTGFEEPYVELDKVQIEQCWVRLLPSNLPAAGYFELKNNTGQELVLTGVESKDYGSAILHENVKKQGMLTMVALPEVRVPTNGKVSFSPITNHIMLENSNRVLKPGDFIGLTFYFQGNGIKTVQCKMKGPNALSY